MKILDCIKNEVIIHCPTKEEDEHLRKLFDLYGRKWRSKASYLEKSHWDNHQNNFCFDINTNSCGNLKYYNYYHDKIVTAKEVLESERQYRVHNPKAFKVGDKVKVICRALDYEGDWTNNWSPLMDKELGKVYIIKDNTESSEYNTEYSGFLLEDCKYPSFCLELVEEKVESDDWCIKVTQENREVIKKWVDNDLYNYSLGYFYGYSNQEKYALDKPFGKLLTTEEFYKQIGHINKSDNTLEQEYFPDLSKHIGRYIQCLVDAPFYMDIKKGEYGIIVDKAHADFKAENDYYCAPALSKDYLNTQIKLMPVGFIPPDNNEFSIGDIVEVIYPGKQFSTYDTLANELMLDRFVFNRDIDTDVVYTIINITRHKECKEKVILALEDVNGGQFLIGVGGVRKVKTDQSLQYLKQFKGENHLPINDDNKTNLNNNNNGSIKVDYKEKAIRLLETKSSGIRGNEVKRPVTRGGTTIKSGSVGSGKRVN